MTRRWWRLPGLILIVLVSESCSFGTSVVGPDMGRIVTLQGSVWHDVGGCTAANGKMLDGSALVFDGHEVILGGACEFDAAMLRAGEMKVVAHYWIRLWLADSYEVSFKPGAAYGDNAMPPGMQVVPFDRLNAAGFRLDYDTGTDSVTVSEPGVGAVIGPRACLGFPVPGCEPD